MYSFAASGWTLAFCFLQYLLDNLKLIALQYKHYVLGYIAASGLISFALCYRFGPMTNPRTKNLIQWSLQVILASFHFDYALELRIVRIQRVLLRFNVYTVRRFGVVIL